MATTPHTIVEKAAQARNLYHRLVLVVGAPRTGKTSHLRHVQEAKGWPLLNLNLQLAERLLDVTARQRALRVADIVNDIVAGTNSDTVMIDNLEMLFHPDLQQDPLRLLQRLSRNRTIIATWRGEFENGCLTYAASEHPEFRRITEELPTLIVKTAANRPARSAAMSDLDHQP